MRQHKTKLQDWLCSHSTKIPFTWIMLHRTIWEGRLLVNMGDVSQHWLCEHIHHFKVLYRQQCLINTSSEQVKGGEHYRWPGWCRHTCSRTWQARTGTGHWERSAVPPCALWWHRPPTSLWHCERTSAWSQAEFTSYLEIIIILTLQQFYTSDKNFSQYCSFADICSHLSVYIYILFLFFDVIYCAL